jgi:hypothetical protein
LTRGNWEKDTSHIKFPDLPDIVKDTLSKFYNQYYSLNKSINYPDLISLQPGIKVCFIDYHTFPPDKLLFTTGYYFKIGRKKYFFDYKKYKTPILYYEGDLYYFSDEYFVKKERVVFEDYADYYNKIFVKYKLKERHQKKHNKRPTGDCLKGSKYNFISKINPY